MIFKLIIMYFSGYIKINVEGFFIEKFLNLCRLEKIYIDNTYINKENTYLELNILKQDFWKIKSIAKKTKCKIKIMNKYGFPFLVNRYKKRNIYAIAILVIAIFIFTITRFIWNIEVYGNSKIEKKEIIELLEQKGIKKGSLKRNINLPKIINDIRKERSDISWIGINIEGTNVEINIEESVEEPQIVDKTKPSNIYAICDSTIIELIVYKGTARVEKNQQVKKGDLLVEGIMESEVYGTREVYADAVIIGEKIIEKEKKEPYKQIIKNKTGEKEIKREICINNFKINLNKGVSKYKFYDTICSTKRLKISPKIELPISINITKYEEIKEEEKIFSEDELKDKIIKELSGQIEKEYNLHKFTGEIIKENISTNEENYLTVKMIYKLQENIGIIEYK